MDEKGYRRKIVADMKTVGTYRKEYDKTIEILAKTYVDMDRAREQFQESGGNIVVKHTNKNGSTNLAKNPYYLSIEGLRSDILIYNRELGLTPAGLKKINGESGKTNKKPGGLAEALMNLEV